VDSTVGSGGVADLLYARLNDGGHRLVLFDINRNRALTGVLRPQAGTMIDRLTRDTRGYELEVVGNTDPAGLDVSVRRLAPDGTTTIREPGLSWPANVVSLGHVALPFAPDDPVYGFVKGSGHDGIPSIGSWLLRGESGTLTLSLSTLTRLRSNPFWSLIDADVAALVAADLAGQAQQR
jgi:hypothetical protein